jgi:hypothetical protein
VAVVFDKEVEGKKRKMESGVVSRRTKLPYLSLPSLGQLGWEILAQLAWPSKRSSMLSMFGCFRN